MQERLISPRKTPISYTITSSCINKEFRNNGMVSKILNQHYDVQIQDYVSTLCRFSNLAVKVVESFPYYQKRVSLAQIRET